MIHICSVYDVRLRSVPMPQALAIVRSSNRLPAGLCWVPDLSPSYKLFKQYLDWRDAGVWNKVTFERYYVPQFVSELKHSTDALKLLEVVKQTSLQGLDIWLACFCKDESLCHRSIVAGILQGLGAAVEAPDYSHYFTLFSKAD